MNIEIDLHHCKLATFEKGRITILVSPFKYKDGRNPRLPRKRSNNYRLQKDTNDFFHFSLEKIKLETISKRIFKVIILVYKGKDRLGSGDLDNYSKAILDGITKTNKLWKDDKQIDKLYIERHYTTNENSEIKIEIEEITPHNSRS